MARYLTPAKIGLLALIELYAEQAVPGDAVLPVLSFISAHLLDRGAPDAAAAAQGARWARAERALRLVLAIGDFEALLAGHAFLRGLPGRSLWDHFLSKLWDLNSLDALHDFFHRIALLLASSKEERRMLGPDDDDDDNDAASDQPNDGKMKLSRRSPFGAFVRKARLEFQRLRFHDSTELWKDFVRYRQPTAHYLRRKNPSFDRLSFDSVLQLGEQAEWDPGRVSALAAVAYGDMLNGDHAATIPVSTDDIELLLDFQIEQMQKYGNRVPLEIRHQFQDLLRDSFLVPSLRHYLSFLDGWRAGDYSTAFDYLHRYFDYTMQHRNRLFYQYALMNLAVLQADFGCQREAVSAMLETVTTARENRDMTCLNFALNWLFHFGCAHPDLIHDLESNSLLGTGKESLAFLRVKARETGMWTLWSSVLLSEAKLALLKGDSVATSLENMVRSSHIIVVRNAQTMFGAQLSLQAALWKRLGLTALSTLASDLFLVCHAPRSVFDDELKHTCRTALALAERGRYDDALARLDRLDENSLRSWKPSQHWHKYRGILRLMRDLHHNNLDGARELLDQLSQSKLDDLQPDLALLIDSLQVDYLTRRGDLQSAFRRVQERMASLGDDKGDMASRLTLLLLKVSLLDRCGRPQRAFSTAVRAASMAWRARLMPNLWEAMGALANMLVSLRDFGPAIDLLTAVIPRALECESSALTAQLFSCLADANMGLAGAMGPGTNKRLEFMMRALAAIDKALDSYASIEDVGRQREMMAKKAATVKVMGDAASAADCAAAYVELHKRAEVLSRGAGGSGLRQGGN